MCLRSLTESASWKDRWDWIEKKQTSLERGMEMFAKGSTWISPAKGARVTKPGFSGQRWPRVGRDGGGREEGRREGGRTRRGRRFFFGLLMFQRFFGPPIFNKNRCWLVFWKEWCIGKERAIAQSTLARSQPRANSNQGEGSVRAQPGPRPPFSDKNLCLVWGLEGLVPLKEYSKATLGVG